METQIAKIPGFLTVLSFLGIPLVHLWDSRNHSGDLGGSGAGCHLASANSVLLLSFIYWDLSMILF